MKDILLYRFLDKLKKNLNRPGTCLAKKNPVTCITISAILFPKLKLYSEVCFAVGKRWFPSASQKLF